MRLKKTLTTAALITLVYTGGFSSAFAQPPAARTKTAATEGSAYFTMTDQGDKIRFRLAYSVNEAGQFQVEAFLLQNRGLYDSEKIVFYGRDLDGDEYPETWFIRQDIFITRVVNHERTNFTPKARLGQDAILHIVKEYITPQKDKYFGELFLKAGDIGTTTVAEMLDAKEEFVRNEVDLYSLQVQINQQKERLSEGAPIPKELQRMQALVEQGYDRNLEHLERALEGGYWKSAFIETAIDVTIVKVGQIFVSGGTWLARSMGNMKRAAKIAESFEVFTKRLKIKLGLGTTAKITVAQATLRGVYGLSYEAILAEARATLRGLAARNKLTEKVFGALTAVGRTYYRGSITQFKYLAQTQMLQVIAEAYDKRAEIYDPNPIIMAKNLVNNKEFIQNVSFMTNETILMAGISSGGGSLKRRVAVVSVVSFFDSIIMNVAIKGEADTKRIGMDTGWEVVIGNLQTQLDVSALKYFEELSIKQKNPKLKLVGYAVALVDQFSGYVAYSKASRAVNESKDAARVPQTTMPEIKLIPILAEI